MCKTKWITESTLPEKDSKRIVKKFDQIFNSYGDDYHTEIVQEWSAWIRANYDWGNDVRIGAKWSGFGGALELMITEKFTEEFVLHSFKQ